MTIPEVKRGPDGQLLVRTLRVPIHKLNIKYVDDCGNVMTPDSTEEPKSSHFVVTGPGFDGLLVRRVVLPTLDYREVCKPLEAIVEVYDCEEIKVPEVIAQDIQRSLTE